MSKVFFAVVGAVLVGAALYLSGVFEPKDVPKLTLQAVLVETDQDVSDRVTWFVERDNAWMGPDFAVVTEAVPGDYVAKFQVLGEEDVTAEISLAEDQGGTLLANLDATLIEIELPEDVRTANVSFRFESAETLGNQGIFVSETGFARTLVSRDLTKLELEIGDRSVPVQADFSAGTVLTFELGADGVRSSQ